ncbi:MAG: TetR/AcrR family transcriptional regulator [Chromatiaceae bacterium]
MSSKGEKTRSDIVNSAKALFYERGYDGTSFTDIVEAAGVYRGNIYHYFKSKDDILGAVIVQHLDAYRALITAWEANSPDPRDRLVAFVDMLAAQAPALTRFGCPIGSLNTELGKDRRDLQKAARALFDLFRDWLTARMGELGYAGEEARALALHLLGRAQGIAVLGHVYQDQDLLQGETDRLRDWLAGL